MHPFLGNELLLWSLGHEGCTAYTSCLFGRQTFHPQKESGPCSATTGAESLQARLFDQKEWRGWSCPRQKTLGQMETRLYTWMCCRLGSARLVAGSSGCSLLIEYIAEVVAAWRHELQEILDLRSSDVVKGDQRPQPVVVRNTEDLALIKRFGQRQQWAKMLFIQHPSGEHSGCFPSGTH